jgi:DNA-directed RNA polymerase specialized sigma24 family protein
MIAHQRWTQSHITELRSRLELGASAADIAEALERPLENVRMMMSRLRLRARV